MPMPIVTSDRIGTNVLFIYMDCTYMATLFKQTRKWEVRHWSKGSWGSWGPSLALGDVDPRVITEAERLLAIHKLTAL